jgi:hypothetical protein
MTCSCNCHDEALKKVRASELLHAEETLRLMTEHHLDYFQASHLAWEKTFLRELKELLPDLKKL